ncbi:MAG: hypothetical protein ACYTKD_11285 [Planctomycetota bacterium]|jgi:hypothetical protein
MRRDARAFRTPARLALACACAASLAPAATAASDILKAGDFEGVEGRSFWHSNGGDVVEAPRPGAAGRSVFRVTTAEPKWQMGRQKLGVPGDAKSMRLSGWARTEDVKPPPDVEWRRAQMQIGYHDAAGQLIGQWNDIDLPLGRSQWTFYKSDFPVPAGARTMIVFLGNNNVSGTSCFDDVRVEPLDADGKPLGVAVGAAKLAGVETVVEEPAPDDAKAGDGDAAEGDSGDEADAAAVVQTDDETDDQAEDDADGGDPDDAGGISAFTQAMIGGGAVLAMMAVFALVARGRSDESADE